jgi:hypothetical protein
VALQDLSLGLWDTDQTDASLRAAFHNVPLLAGAAADLRRLNIDIGANSVTDRGI